MENMIEFVHNRIKQRNYECGIDFTMGNGYDTLFLSQYCRSVYSFDIQEIAFNNTKQLIGEKENIHLFLDSHENFDCYVDYFDIGVFNLGYLPNGDHHITTQKEVTLRTLSKALRHLNHSGHIYLVVYIGHENGQKESELLDEYVQNLDHRMYNVAVFKMMNKNHAPYVIEIEKR